MNKKFFSGILALGIGASMFALASGATKLGDVNNDGMIDIEDAVSIINHVNGVTPLTEKQANAADINCDSIVDIEDAVKIINHINGVNTLPDVVVTGSEDTTDGEDETPTDVESEPGSRTPKLFAQIADSNYSIAFKGQAVVIGAATDVEASVNQIDKNHSIVKVDMNQRNVHCLLYIIDGLKYKIKDFEKQTFTATLSLTESMLDFNAIFVSMASNEDALIFLGQTDDEETGYAIEQYQTAISNPIPADVIVEAYYDKKTDELKKLVMYTTNYKPETQEGTLYISTDTIEFSPSYEHEGDLPDFSKWTKV